MGDQQKALTRWMQILIESEMPQGVDERTIQKYQSFFMRMLSGRFGPSTSTLRSSQIGGSSSQASEERMIKTQLMRQAKTSHQQLRIQELLNKLDKYPSALQNKSSMLLLLYKLSDTAEIKQHFDNVEALFKNNKQGLQQNQNVTMEIENNTTMNTLSNNQSNAFNQTQRSILSQSNVQFLQTVKRIHNKGNPNIDLAEKDLIRDLLFIFQAIDGHYINFSKIDEKFILKSNVSVSDPVRELVNKLCVMGDLYRKIKLYLEIEPQGQIRQALHQAIRDELNEYYRLIVIFENELNSTINNQNFQTAGGNSLLLSQAPYQNQGQSNNYDNQQNQQNNQNTNQFTLRKLQLWVIEPQERLKWLAVVCDATKGMSGFQVISAVNAYETQGSPPIQQLISRILQSIVQPFIKYVNSWVYNGELNDPLGEFFVTENIGESDIWNKRYQMVVKQIPNIIDQKNAIKIFNIGRSINFLHRSCKSSDWKLNLAPCDLKIVDKKSFDVFKQWIDQAAFLTNNRIVNILVDKYQLKFHLQNIKRYILMGQGDFIQSLMEILSEQLSKNANEIHRHNLLAQLDGVIKSNNNAYLENSQRLDIKLLEASPGDKGWDIFTLDYNVDSPIDTILSPSVMKNYLKIFNFLWRVRRVSHCLSSVWIDHMKSASLINKDKQNESIAKLMKKFNILRHQMTHFINNLTCYIMVDAIESTWKQFLDDFDKTQDFAQIIQTHTNFVQSVLDKSLLTEKNINIYRQMNSLFNLIIKFRNTQMVILTEIQEEYERIREVKNTNNQKRILNIHHRDYDNEDDENGSDNQLESEDFQIPKTAKQFNQLQNDFKNQFAELLVLLKKEDKLRFLSFKLDFNEYYHSRQSEQQSFNQEQLNKYSASRNLKMNTNFNIPSGSGVGSSNNLNSDNSLFSNTRTLFNLGGNSSSLPPNRETSQFFNPDNKSKQTLLGTNSNLLGQGIEFNTKDSFLSNNNNNLKNSGFIRKDSSFVQNNPLFNQDSSQSKTNFNKNNISTVSNDQRPPNNYFQNSSKQEFFKTNNNTTSNYPSIRNQRSFDNIQSNLDSSNNRILNNKMDEEYIKDNQTQNLNLFVKNNQFNNYGESDQFRKRVNSHNQPSNEEMFSKQQTKVTPPQQNNFFKLSNTQKEQNRYNVQKQSEEDQKYQDSDEKNQINYRNYDSKNNFNRSDQKEEEYDDEDHDEYGNQVRDSYDNDEDQNDQYDNYEDHDNQNFE